MEKLQEAKECTRMHIADDFHAIKLIIKKGEGGRIQKNSET